MTDCDKDLVVMYIINDKNSICVPTFGKFPKIIDFGFSYTSDLENKNFYTTLAHTDVGFMSCTNDFISDLKLFLVTCSYDINHHRNSINSRNLRHVIRNIFKPLDIDWEAGWDHYTRAGATDKLLEHINHLYSPSKLFQKYDHYCIDIFQSLVKLPLRPKKYDKINLAVTSFIKEFHKIEENVNCSIISLYILRQIVEHSRHLKLNYKKNVKETSLQFRTLVLNDIDKIISYFNVKNIDFTKMLCSIYLFSECIEGYLHHQVSLKIEEQDNAYKELKLKNPCQIFACIESNIPHNYTYNKNTKVLILDSVHNNQHTLTDIPNFILNLLNSSHNLSHDSILFDYVTNKLDKDIESYNNLSNTKSSSTSSVDITPPPPPIIPTNSDIFTSMFETINKLVQPFETVSYETTLDNINKELEIVHLLKK